MQVWGGGCDTSMVTWFTYISIYNTPPRGDEAWVGNEAWVGGEAWGGDEAWVGGEAWGGDEAWVGG